MFGKAFILIIIFCENKYVFGKVFILIVIFCENNYMFGNLNAFFTGLDQSRPVTTG